MNAIGPREAAFRASRKALRAKFFPPVQPVVSKAVAERIEQEKIAERESKELLKQLLAKYKIVDVGPCKVTDINVEDAKERKTAQEIVQMVALKHGTTAHTLFTSKRRNKNIVYPRQEAQALIVTQLGWSLPRVARMFGQDHTTVLHGIRSHAKRLAERGEVQ